MCFAGGAVLKPVGLVLLKGAGLKAGLRGTPVSTSASLIFNELVAIFVSKSRSLCCLQALALSDVARDQVMNLSYRQKISLYLFRLRNHVKIKIQESCKAKTAFIGESASRSLLRKQETTRHTRN